MSKWKSMEFLIEFESKPPQDLNFETGKTFVCFARLPHVTPKVYLQILKFW